jgi:hypothetical protein
LAMLFEPGTSTTASTGPAAVVTRSEDVIQLSRETAGR